MTDPVTQLIQMAPTPAIIHVAPGIGEAGGAKPSNKSLDTLPTQSAVGVIGNFSNAVDAELDGSASAIFTIKAADLPDGVQEDVSRLKVDGNGGGDYVIDKIRKRFWFGQLNGYTFALRL